MRKNTGISSPYWSQLGCIAAAFLYTAIKTHDLDGFLLILKFMLVLIMTVCTSTIIPLRLITLLVESRSSRRESPMDVYRIQGHPERFLELYAVMTVSLCIPLWVNLYWLYFCTAVPIVLSLYVLIKRNRYYRKCGYNALYPILLSFLCIAVSLGFHFIVYRRS